MEDINLSVFNTVTGVHESKILVKHISCTFRLNFDGREYDPKQQYNNDKCWYELKKTTKYCMCKEDCAWDPTVCTLVRKHTHM